MTKDELAIEAGKIADRVYGDLKPSADKRGRNPKFPFVPTIIDQRDSPTCAKRGGPDGKEQILGKAFETRERATGYAQKVIDFRRDTFRDQLLEPRHRAQREQFGLPREIEA